MGRGSSAPLKGIAFMMAGGALLTANDAVLKWLTGGYPVGEIMFVRGLFVLPVIGFFVWRGGLASLRVHDRASHALRAGLMIGGTYLFVTGLRLLPLADAISIAFAGPLFVTAMAGPMLGEHVGWRRWMAVLAGFAGILIIFQPGSGMFQWAALLPLAASGTGALRDIMTRKMSASETSESLLFYSTCGVMLGGLGSLPFGWVRVADGDWLLFATSGVLIGGAHFCMIETFRHAEAALVSPFKYVNVLWASLFGFLVFADVPAPATVLGSAVVISSGIYILQRERRRRRPAAPAQKR